ncbi:hypothetical protein BMS3Abin17_00782 [archaeon BMS3Abin17]|nr:hypothetical protein BMS3Abin17_00782 [archaeon BMS3Abin17]
MKIKIRYRDAHGMMRLENDVKIKEVMINEDIMHPESESIALGFTNKNSSGIIEMSSGEFDRLNKSVKDKIHLIKGVKIFREEK